MKRFILAGIVILVAMFVVTCDEAPVAADAEIEYTDVVVSQDGSQVTIYLDGEMVPVPKAQRAMTLDLAKMSYDYLEVVFQNSAGVSRSAWELGQPAGISGGGLRTGDDYGAFPTSGTTPGACLFAGQKAGKTLFGVGKLTSSTGGAADTTITSGTKSVTFSLAAIQTGLRIYSEAAGARGTVASSFSYTTGGTGGGDTTTQNNSSLQSLPDGVQYPSYALPKGVASTTNALYNFYFIVGGQDKTGDYAGANKAIFHWKYLSPATSYLENEKPQVQKRTPRFMDGGRYLQPNGHIDTAPTKISFTGTYPSADAAAFTGTVPLTFTTTVNSGGIFSFYLEIPVYNLTQATAGHNGGPVSEKWYIRTGLGADLYSLDDGVSSGGCVFMSSGVTSSDWLEIDWVWLPSAAPSP